MPTDPSLRSGPARDAMVMTAENETAIVITDDHGRVEWVNEGFTRLTGEALPDVVGRVPTWFGADDESSGSALAYIRHRPDRARPFEKELHQRRHEGRDYVVCLEVHAVHDESGTVTRFVAIGTDVTAKQEASRLLQAQLDIARALAGGRSLKNLLEMIARHIRFGAGVLWLPDDAGSALFCAEVWVDSSVGCAEFDTAVRNRRLAPNEGAAGRSWTSAVPTSIGNDGPAREAVAPGFHCNIALPIVSQERVIGVLEFFCTRTTPPERKSLDALTPITAQLGQFLERLRAEEALHRHAASLAETNAELEKAAKMKSVFLASMSHSLRTPLTGILGMSETLLEQVYGPLNERQLRYLGVIENSGRQLLALIDDLLELARNEAGPPELNRIRCTIDELCQPSFELVQAFAARRRQQAHYDNETGPLTLDVDVARIAKVLDNLLGNAAKFTPEGGEFGLRVTTTSDEVCFTIWDRGIGIAPADLPKLFQPFVQLDTRLARRYDGTGLGLALVKHLVELHGGRVAARSEVGVGSEFSVYLPRE